MGYVAAPKLASATSNAGGSGIPAAGCRTDRPHHGSGRRGPGPPDLVSRAREAAQAYVDAVNAADLDGLLDLFAKDAVLRHPSGVYEGIDALAGFYGDVVFPAQAC